MGGRRFSACSQVISGPGRILPPSSVFGLVPGEGEGAGPTAKRKGFGPDLKGLILKLIEDLVLVDQVVPPFLYSGDISLGAPEDMEGAWCLELGLPTHAGTHLPAHVAFPQQREDSSRGDLAHSPRHLPLVPCAPGLVCVPFRSQAYLGL